jgi:ribosomal protein L24E
MLPRRTVSVALAALLAATVAVSAGCKCPGASEASVTAAGTILPPDPGKYYVETKDGRIYVFGSDKVHDSWIKTGHMQFSKTLIGAGSGGETLVFEALDKNPAMEKRLIARYSSENGLKL